MNRILICVDSGVALIVARWLSHEGYEIEIADTVEEGTRRIADAHRADAPYAALFTDSAELVRNIRQSPAGSTPILYRGADPSSVLANQVLPASASLHDVSQRLRKMLSERPPPRPEGGGGRYHTDR